MDSAPADGTDCFDPSSSWDGQQDAGDYDVGQMTDIDAATMNAGALADGFSDMEAAIW
jgi:hypothetical protein